MRLATKAIALLAVLGSVAQAQDMNTDGPALGASNRPEEATPDTSPRKLNPGNAKQKTVKASAAVNKIALRSAASPQVAVGQQPAQRQARAPAGGVTAPGELEPVLHARNAKIGACMDNVLAQAGGTINAPHDAVSTWVTAAPNDNVFQSIVGINYPGKAAPNGAAILLAAPVNGKKCEGQSIQIIPSAQSCTTLQATIVRSSAGSTLAMLRDLPLMQMKDGSRSLLLPSAGSGCVLISVHLR